ncbi:MAG: hypothetical protein L0206_24975, partial [Actinobacteria bacterium]|nr:hypothetical protein [Actinomycetota bacterium]
MRTRRRSTLLGRSDFSVSCWLALAAVLAAGPRSGLDAANTIAIGVGEGSPGSSDVQVIVTAANDVSVHGYSIAFTYPADVLELSRISTNGTGVQALEPDFVGSAFDNQLGVASM